MKALFVSAAAAAFLAAAAPAHGQTVVSIGNSTARDCYEAAVGGDHDRNAFNHCNLALKQEGLTERDTAATLVNRGILHMRNRDYRSAGRDFDRALAFDATNGEAWLNMAIAELQQGAGLETLPKIEKAFALGTNWKALAHYSRAVAYERGGKIRAAYYDLKMANTIDPRWREPIEDLKRYQVRR
jgi:tetratricopeptide (TPR) repeat protein